MTTRLVFREEAEADILEAYVWYSDRLPRLAEEFLAAIDEVRGVLRASPGRFPVIREEPGLAVRRVLLRRFAYGVLFIWDSDRDQISVVGCLHVRRDPMALLRRL